MWRPGGKRPGRGRAAREVGPFPSATTKSLSLGCREGPRPQPLQPGQDTSSRPPPPTSQPCPAFPVNTSTSSGGRAWRCWGVGGPHPAACETSTQWLARGSSWPLQQPGPSLRPKEMPLLVRTGWSADAPLAQAGQGKSAGPCWVPPPCTSPFHPDCRVFSPRGEGAGQEHRV